MRKLVGALVVVGIALAISACDQSQPSKGKGEVQMPPEMKRMLEPLPAGLQAKIEVLGKRLNEYLSEEDGFYIVRDPVRGMFQETILPVTSPWSIECGMGLKLVFGTGVSGDSAEVTNEATITLSMGLIPIEECKPIGLALARSVRDLHSNSGR